MNAYEYDSSPIHDGEYYYCEFYNDSWYLTDGGSSKAHPFYLSGKVGSGEYLEHANAFVDRRRGAQVAPLRPLFDLVLDMKGKRLTGSGVGNLFAVVMDETGRLFLRVNQSPPKKMYFTNPVNTWDDSGWYFEIEKLRGHGDKNVRATIRASILAELQQQSISVPRIPWHQTYRAVRRQQG